MSYSDRSWLKDEPDKEEVELGLVAKVWYNKIRRLSSSTDCSSLSDETRISEKMQVASFNMGLVDKERQAASASYMKGVYRATPIGEQSIKITGGPIDSEKARKMNKKAERENAKYIFRKKKRFTLLCCY